jgi:hypothetical protein
MKMLFFYLAVFSFLTFSVSCRQNNHIAKNTEKNSIQNTSEDSNTYNDVASGNDNTVSNDDFGQITFTSRGEHVVCSPSENGALFRQNVAGHYVLLISGINRKVPPHHQNSIDIEINIKGKKLHTGTFELVGAKFLDCVSKKGTCGEIGFAQTGIKGKPTTLKEYQKGLQSASGTVKITDVEIGDFSMGFAKGYISGSFSFSGTELGKLGRNPGSASGKFEHIPLLVTK